MNTVISVLIVYIFNSYQKDVYYVLAKYLLEHITDVETISIDTLAKECGTSSTTINKFCRQIGLDNYKHLKIMLSNTKNGRLDQIIKRYSKFDKEQFYNMIGVVDEREQFEACIDRVVDLIHDANTIYMIGAVYPLSLTINFVEDMILFGKNITFEQIGFKDNIESLSENDLLFLITITGRVLKLNKQYFLKIIKMKSKKIAISQNALINDLFSFDEFIQLINTNHNEIENAIIIEILNYIKFVYFHKYTNFFIFNLEKI